MKKIENPFIELYRSKPYSSPYKTPLVEFPFIIDVEATNICNLDCIMCPRQIMSRPKGFMDFGLFKKIISEITVKGGKGIRFIGYGESLLNPNIFKMIKYANSKQLLTHLTTNGILLDKEKIEKIFHSKLDSIIFSFQGTTKEEYAKMRNNPFYNKIEDNIKQLVNERNKKNLTKPYVQVTTTLLDETKEQTKIFYNKWEKIVDKVDHWYTSLKHISHLEKVKSLLKRQKTDKHLGIGKCPEVRTKLTVFWNGDVNACCGAFDNQLKLGNIKNNSLKEIWNSDKLNNIRRILEKNERYKLPLCAKCNNKFSEK